MRSRTIIVTGAGGFIGSYVIEDLIKAGYSVIGVDLKEENDFILRAGIETDKFSYVMLNLEDEKAIEQFSLSFEDGNISILHLAGHKNNCDINNSPLFWEIVKKHVFPTVNILEAFKDKLDFFMFSSSMAVYGIPLILPVSENYPETPKDAYGYSKLMNESLLRSFCQNHKVPLSILRIASVYDSTNLSKAILNIKDKISKRETVTIYGSRMVSRDYLHISDLSKAIVSVIDQNTTGTLNLGSGFRTPLKKIIEKLEELYKSKAEIVYDKSKPDSFDFELDISLAKNVLKFNPIVNILEVLNDDI